MADRENEETQHSASVDDQVKVMRTVVQLLKEPDGRKKAKEALFEYWRNLKEPDVQ